MEMRALNQLCEMCCEELSEIVGNDQLTMTTLEQAHKLTDTIKNIKKIEMLEGGGRGRYSRAYDRDDYGYERGYSYDAYDGTESSRRGDSYSRGGGKEKMMGQIDEMMRGANERQKEVLRRMREEIKNT